MSFTHWQHGDWNAICDRCGVEFKASQLRQTWDGLMVCPDDWEPRHPQDMVRPVQDQNKLPWTQPEGTDTDVGDLSPLYIVSLAASQQVTFVAPDNYEIATTTMTVTLPLSGIIIIEAGAVIENLTINPPTTPITTNTVVAADTTTPLPTTNTPTEIQIVNNGSVYNITNNSGVAVLGVISFVFIQQPTNVLVNGSISPAVVIEAQDSEGNRDLDYSGPITIALDNNPNEATLSGTLSKNAVDGRATFSDLSIDKFGSGYTLAVSVT